MHEITKLVDILLGMNGGDITAGETEYVLGEGFNLLTRLLLSVDGPEPRNFRERGQQVLSAMRAAWTILVREVFVVHVGGTRCVTSSTDNIMKRQARITLTVDCIRGCIVIFLILCVNTRTSMIKTHVLFDFTGFQRQNCERDTYLNLTEDVERFALTKSLIEFLSACSVWSVQEMRTYLVRGICIDGRQVGGTRVVTSTPDKNLEQRGLDHGVAGSFFFDVCDCNDE